MQRDGSQVLMGSLEAFRRKPFQICKITGEWNPDDVLHESDEHGRHDKENRQSIGGFFSVAQTSRSRDCMLEQP